MKENLAALVTESRNPASLQIDTLDSQAILSIINREDTLVAQAVAKSIPQIASCVDAITEGFASGGRLIYVGAGTSGRLGILDASECPPTYGTPPEQVVGVIAGGKQAVFSAVENAEDNPVAGRDDLKALNINKHDVVVGIAASGRTPYVVGAMDYARSQGARVGAICCNAECVMADNADFPMVAVVGPEVVTGSSRMKAGTAQKLILNMLTTAAMIRSGKVYGNLMVDVEATNAKLRERQVRIVMDATGCDEDQALGALSSTGLHCKTAILTILADCSPETAREALASHNGFVRAALKALL